MFYFMPGFLSLISNAMADGKAASPASAVGPQGPLASFAPFLLMIVVFYFLLIRPQKKKMQEEQQMLNSLKVGDEIYTKSGLIGIMQGATDKVVTLEIANNVNIKILRSQVGGLAKKLFETRQPTTKSKNKK